MRNFISLVVLALSKGALLAQPATPPEKREFTLELAMNPGVLQPRGIAGLQWAPDGERYTWVARQPGPEGPDVAIMVASVEDGSPTPLLTLTDLRRAAKDVGIDVSARSLLSMTWLPHGRWLRLVQDQGVFHVGLDPVTVAKKLALPKEAREEKFFQDHQVAWVQGDNVWVHLRDGSRVQATKDGHDDLKYGQSVSRVEFGITDGLWWSPEGGRLAFYREDFRPIAPYPYTDFRPTPAKRVLGRYPMAGQAGSRVGVGVFDTKTQEVVWLATDPEVDEYLTNVTWDPSGERLLVVHVNRAQDAAQLVVYDAATGKRLARLLEEKDPQWIEPEKGPIFVPDGSGRFLWFSPRNGFRHLYLYTPSGEDVRQVTTGEFDVSEFVAWEGADGFWFRSSGSNPLEKHLFFGSLSGEQRRVTRGRGQHDAVPAPRGRRVLDAHHHLELPMMVDLLDGEGEPLRKIHEAPNPLDRLLVGPIQLFTAKAHDGAPLHGLLMLPPKMEPGQKFPVIQYVYGGPHSQLVVDGWLSGVSRWKAWMLYMATRGYVVMVVDGRGTTNRGIEWVQAVHRQLGTLEIQDQVAALDHVVAMGVADPERVGVTGWSYGGFMTLSLMTRAKDRYRVGVSGAPVTDWAYYETGYGERYMDTPEENPEGYKTADPSNHVTGLKGRLLVVHGSNDETVMWQSTMHFLDRCIEAGAPVDYMVYPGHLHGLSEKAFDHFIRKKTDYFEQHLKAGASGN